MAKKAGGKNTARAVRPKSYRPPTAAEVAAHRAELELEAKEREAQDLARSQTPEELERARKRDEARRLMREISDIRDGLIPPPWMKPTRKRKAKTKEQKPLGRPPVPREPIEKAIENYIADNGLPAGKLGKPTAEALANQAYLVCDDKKIAAPDSWTVMKEIVSPIFGRHKPSRR